MVNTLIINGLKSKGITIGDINPEVLEAFSCIMHEYSERDYAEGYNDAMAKIKEEAKYIKNQQ